MISKIGGVLTGMGYSLKDAEMEIKSLGVKQAEDNVTMSKTSGSLIAESPLDILKRRVKSDIVIQVWWNITKNPAGKIVSFTLEAFDAYTNKRIATSTGNSRPSNEAIPVILEKAVKENIKEFDKQLDRWYAEQKKLGREINLTVRCWDNWDQDLESEYAGEELTDIIQDWIRENAVNGSFNLSDGSELFSQFEQIRIPLKDDKGNATDARTFATSLRKFLQYSTKLGFSDRIGIRDFSTSHETIWNPESKLDKINIDLYTYHDISKGKISDILNHVESNLFKKGYKEIKKAKDGRFSLIYLESDKCLILGAADSMEDKLSLYLYPHNERNAMIINEMVDWESFSN